MSAEHLFVRPRVRHLPSYPLSYKIRYFLHSYSRWGSWGSKTWRLSFYTSSERRRSRNRRKPEYSVGPYGSALPQGQHEHRQTLFQLFLLTFLLSKRDTKWVMWVWEDSSNKSSSELMENLLEKSWLSIMKLKVYESSAIDCPRNES